MATVPHSLADFNINTDAGPVVLKNQTDSNAHSGFAGDARDDDQPQDPWPCPDIVWQGPFAQVADIVGQQDWGVWGATFAALGATIGKNLDLFFYRPLHAMPYVLIAAPTSTGKGTFGDI